MRNFLETNPVESIIDIEDPDYKTMNVVQLYTMGKEPGTTEFFEIDSREFTDEELK